MFTLMYHDVGHARIEVRGKNLNSSETCDIVKLMPNLDAFSGKGN